MRPLAILDQPDRFHDRIATAFAELPCEESFVLAALYCPQMGSGPYSYEEIALQLGIEIQEVWDIEARALEMLAFLLLTDGDEPVTIDLAEAA